MVFDKTKAHPYLLQAYYLLFIVFHAIDVTFQLFEGFYGIVEVTEFDVKFALDFHCVEYEEKVAEIISEHDDGVPFLNKGKFFLRQDVYCHAVVLRSDYFLTSDELHIHLLIVIDCNKYFIVFLRLKIEGIAKRSTTGSRHNTSGRTLRYLLSV